MLVVTPLLTLLLAMAFWFYQIHMKELGIMRKVREPVWATATFGCGRAGETSARYPGTQPGVSVDDAAPVYVPGTDYSRVYTNAPGGPNNEVITRSTADARVSATDTLDGDEDFHFRQMNLRAHATMMCNETVHDGQPDAYKRITAAAFQP
jgi:hypothetical protein